jgi:hypothetical protein
VGPSDTATFAYLAINEGHGDTLTDEEMLSNYTRQFSENVSGQVQPFVANQQQNQPSTDLSQAISTFIGALIWRGGSGSACHVSGGYCAGD